jgi:hypothetical protein
MPFILSTTISRSEEKTRFACGTETNRELVWTSIYQKEVVYSPTLTELIEACGAPFYLSCTDTGHWLAANTANGEGGQTGEGETPAEAVARLWLLLEVKFEYEPAGPADSE